MKPITSDWEAALEHLNIAAQSFLEASITLRNAALESCSTSRDPFPLEETVLSIQSNTYKFEQSLEAMTMSRTNTNLVLNMSTERVPIRRLPPEVLGKVFSMVVEFYPHNLVPPSKNLLMTLAQVCAHWRQTSIAKQSLWANIDIGSEELIRTCDPKFLNRTKLWLERSQAVPIHIYLRRRPVNGSTDTSQLVPLLRSHIPRVASLICGHPPATYKSLVTLFDICPLYGTPGSVTKLVVVGMSDRHLGPRTAPLTWPVSYFQGLVELRLTQLPEACCPTLSDIWVMLSSSLSLQVLRLGQLTIRPSPEDFCDLPIELSSLRLLHLGELSATNLMRILPIISTNCNIDMSLPLLDDHRATVAIQTFLERTKVISLDLRIPSAFREPLDARVVQYLDSFPHLKILSISYGGAFHEIMTILLASMGNGFVARFPQLHTLRLLSGGVYLNELRKIASLYAFHRLIVVNCIWAAPQPGDEENLELNLLAGHTISPTDSGTIGIPDQTIKDIYVTGALDWLRSRIPVVVAGKEVEYSNWDSEDWETFVQNQINNSS
ncbi:hypothetical protein FRC12_004939 [Ceratobasidium sp. 428]|nr:hypothetical protein FRC12_004939 [Ceratobasidium sp. 428]